MRAVPNLGKRSVLFSLSFLVLFLLVGAFSVSFAAYQGPGALSGTVTGLAASASPGITIPTGNSILTIDHGGTGTGLAVSTASSVIPGSAPALDLKGAEGAQGSQRVGVNPSFSAGTQVSTGATASQYNGGPTYTFGDNSSSVESDSEGNLVLAFASGTSTKAGWGIWFEYSMAGSGTWSGLTELEAPGSGQGLAEPSLAVYTSSGTDYVCLSYISISTSASTPQGNYFVTCSSGASPEALGSWSTPVGDSTNGDGFTTGDVSGPTSAFDSSGNLVVAFVGEIGSGNYYWGWDIYSDTGVYSADHSYSQSTIGGDGAGYTIGLACASSGCSTSVWGFDSGGESEVDMLTTTDDYSSITDNAIITENCQGECGLVGYPMVQDIGPGSVAGSGSNWVAGVWYYDGSSYYVLNCYSSNLWSTTSGCSTSNSPGGGAVADNAFPEDFPVVTDINGAQFEGWESGSKAVVVNAQSSIGGTWTGTTTVSTAAFWPFLSVSAATPWMVSLTYLTTASLHQVYYSSYVEPSVSAFNPSPASVDVNQNVTFSPTFSGGTGVYSTYAWTASSPNFGCGVATGATYTCDPTSSTGSPFTVSVTVTDSWGFSGTATSPSYTVYPDPTVGVPTAVPATVVDQGQNVTFTSAAPSGGLAPYTYAWTKLPTGCLSSGAATDVCAPTGSGSFSVIVMVTDKNGYPAISPTLNYTVDPTLNVSLVVSPSVIDLGQSVNLTTTAKGGSGTYSYVYNGLPGGCVTANLVTLQCTPTSAGTASGITVTATDTNSGKITSAPGVSFKVNPKLSITSFVASSNPDKVGSLTDLTVGTSGGTTPLTYSYVGLPGGCATVNAPSLNCTPTASGSFSVTVTVVDSLGKSATGKLNLTVTSSSTAPTITSFVAAPNPVDSGAATTITTTVTGGVTPYTFVYSGLPSGCTTANSSSLKCTPTASGNFTVGVTVSDPAGKSTSSTLKLDVVGPTITSFTVSPTSVTVGTQATFTAVVTGGATPYTYVYAGLPSGCSTGNVSSLPCTPSSQGTYNVTVRVTDSLGSSVLSTPATLTVTQQSGPVISSFTVTPSTVTVGGNVSFSVSASGGTTPYSYVYTGLPTGCTSADTATLACSPQASGSFPVTVTVTDAKSLTATKSVTLTVSSGTSGGPSISSMVASPNPVNVNSSVTVTSVVTGGTSPYTYSYSGLPIGCSSVNAEPLTCTPSTPGNYTIVLTVTDSKGKQASDHVVLVVLGSIQPLSVTISSNTTSFQAGSSVLLTASVKGGDGPYTYAWAINGSVVSGAPDSATWTDTINHSGTYTFSVTVTDGQKKQAESQNLMITVTPPVSQNSSPFAFPWWILLLVIVAVVVGMLLYMDNRRRSANKARAEAGAQDMGAAEGVAGGEMAPAALPEGSTMLMDESMAAAAAGGAAGAYAGMGESEAPPPESLPEYSQIPEETGPKDYYVAPSEAEQQAAPPESQIFDAGAQVTTTTEEQQAQTQQTFENPPVVEPEAPQIESSQTDLGTDVMRAAMAAPPAPQMVETSPETLTNCPQCDAPLGPDMYCANCGVAWVHEAGGQDMVPPEEAPMPPPPVEVAALTSCPMCNGPLAEDNSCPVCGVVWTRDSQSGGSMDVAPSPPAPEPEPMPEPSPEQPERNETDLGKAASDMREEISSAPKEPEVPIAQAQEPEQAAAPVPEPEPVVAPIPPPKPTTPEIKSKLCFVCGSALEGDFCPVCNVHWGNEGPA